MVTSVKQMLETANAAVPKITPDQASDMIKKGNTLVVDVRDAPEVSASGKIAGAVNVSRGMLEFRADPDSPYHDKNFDKEKTVILYCASGGRSALAGKVLKDMGYEPPCDTTLSSIGTAARWRAGTPPCLERRPPNRYYAASTRPSGYVSETCRANRRSCRQERDA